MNRIDVLVMGGGLAGLTLALQLRQRLPALSVQVIERRTHPVPVAAHKVGESTVEIGAHYFADVLGLRTHLETAQLRKFGFRFFFSDGRSDIDRVTEIGASRTLPVGSFQIDRGLFENHLAEEAARRGVQVAHGARVRRVTLGTDARADASTDASTDAGAGPAEHHIEWVDADGTLRETRARWVVDACGRASLLKRQLGLARGNTHAAHSAWFRIGARIAIDDWSADPAWQARVDMPERWRSTNHLVGPGYWVWLIPLASGSHSVGIVADPAFHPSEQIDRFDKAMAWLARHQPRLHEALVPLAGQLQDFAFLRRFSHDAAQLFSADRWALAGEAGRFLDPFYSPGSDFIAIVNTYLTDLIARDHAGERIGARTHVYEQIVRSFHDSTYALYEGQYALFGCPEVLPEKIVWDYAYYWGVLAQLVMHERLTDLASMGALRDELQALQARNRAVQTLLARWGAVAGARGNAPRMLDHAAVPWFVRLNASLADRLDDDGFRARIRQSARLLARLSATLLDRARAAAPGLQVSDLQAVLTDRADEHPPLDWWPLPGDDVPAPAAVTAAAAATAKA